jgi:hypothetical protein
LKLANTGIRYFGSGGLATLEAVVLGLHVTLLNPH